MSILILGGTNLTGPHNVRYALERGHSVTIFTRGRAKPGLFQDQFKHVEQLVGDRADDLGALEGRRWDAVIDASGMQVEWTRDSARLLKDAADVYLYISSTGVAFGRATRLAKSMRSHLPDIVLGSSFVMAAFGLLLVFDRLPWLTTQMRSGLDALGLDWVVRLG